MKTRTKWARLALLIGVAAGLIGAAGLLTGCKEEAAPPADGTIAARVVNAGAVNGEVFMFVVFAAGADIATEDPIGINGDLIASGTAEEVAWDFDTYTAAFTFTGGSLYDVYGWIDLDTSGTPDSGEPYGSKLAVQVDGNMLVELDYGDFVAFP
jgi:hypothetical protein